MATQSSANSWPRVLLAFAVMFSLYQASEGMQTVFATVSPIGPALMVAALLVAWPLGRWLGWRGYDAFGLEPGSRLPGMIVGGVLLAALAKMASLALAPVSGAGTLGITAAWLSPPLVAFALVSTFIPSLAEDILTRGFLLRAVPVRLGGVAYVLLSATLYTANHIWRLDWGITEQARLFCLGLAYGAAAWRWRSLWGAVALHWGWNFTGTLTDPLFTLDGGSVVAARLLSAAVHLVLLVIVLALPARSADEAEYASVTARATPIA